MLTIMGLERLNASAPGGMDAAVAAEVCVKGAAVLAALLLISAYSAVPGLTIFGHDEVHYYENFFSRLAEDGRWLNHLLHGFLRSIPAGTWACLMLGAFWALFYRLGRSYGFDAAWSALVASTILLANPFVEQVLWPATAMPAVVILLLITLLVERGLSYPLTYLLSGALLFGSLQTVYFLVPLLFLRDFLPSTEPDGKRWLLLFRHLCWWVAGSVLGVLLMSFALLLMTGEFGPQPAGWRLTQPVQDLAGLIRNIVYVSQTFVGNLEFLLRQAGVTKAFLLVLVLALLLRVRALLAMPQALLLLTAVAISFFVFSVPLAPLIHQRSLLALAASVVLFMAFLPGASAAWRVFGILLLLKFAHGASVQVEAYVDRHDAETSYFHDKLKDLVPGLPSAYTAIAVTGLMDPGRPEARIFNDPSQLHPIVLTLGARKYLDCRIELRCAEVGSGKPRATMPFGKGQLSFLVDAGNIGIIHYQE